MCAGTYYYYYYHVCLLLLAFLYKTCHSSTRFDLPSSHVMDHLPIYAGTDTFTCLYHAFYLQLSWHEFLILLSTYLPVTCLPFEMPAAYFPQPLPDSYCLLFPVPGGHIFMHTRLLAAGAPHKHLCLLPTPPSYCWAGEDT